MTAGFWILAGLALQAGPGSAPGTVRGVVRDATDGRPLPNALVTLIRDERTAITDRNGAYVFRDVVPGDRRVRASRIDYQSLEVSLDLPDGSTLLVDFLLTLRPVEMPTVEARASPLFTVDTLVSEPEPVANGAAVVRLLDATPGVAEPGLAAAANVLLGPDPPAPDNVLFVRGAGAALDLILLDGAPVQAPFHLGGLIQPSVSPSIVHAARLQGGASARWDGGLSDVLLLDSRPGFGAGSAARGIVYADMLSAGGLVEGGSPGRASWLVSVRGLHGVGAEPFIEGGFPQDYADGLLRLDVNASEGDTILISGYWNQETIFLGPDDSGADSPGWGNRAAALRFKGDLSIGRSELGAAYGEFGTRLPIGGDQPLMADGITRRTRLAADLTTGWGTGTVGYGLQFDRLDHRTGFRSTVTAVAEDQVELRQRADAGAVSAYVDGSLPVSNLGRISAGLRATSFSNDLGRGLSPRIRADVFLTPEFLFSISAGRYRQLLVASDASRRDAADLAGDALSAPLLPTFTRIAAARSDHYLLALTHSPDPASEFRVEGYWKQMEGLPDLYGGALRYAGLDFWIRKNLRVLEFWGSYSVGWGWVRTDGGPDAELYSGRHLLRGGFTKGFNGGLQLDAELSYGQGLEFGAIPRADRPGSFAPLATEGGAPTPAGSPSSTGPSTAVFAVPTPVPPPVVVRAPQGSYLRLNIQATGRIRAWFFGREQLLFPYFRIINALDRNDALFYQSRGDLDLEPRAVGSIPILPVIGIEWQF